VIYRLAVYWLVVYRPRVYWLVVYYRFRVYRLGPPKSTGLESTGQDPLNLPT
jgi:hypothetical protein